MVDDRCRPALIGYRVACEACTSFILYVLNALCAIGESRLNGTGADEAASSTAAGCPYRSEIVAGVEK